MYVHGDSELYHHGVKGQRWGVRRYQFADGSLTPEGERRLRSRGSVTKTLSYKVSDLTKRTATRITGKQYVDTYLRESTTFKRIQTSKNFEDFAFYATYKKQDSDKYLGLFGKNLKDRAMREAKVSKDKDKIDAAERLEVYQLSISAKKRIKIPSDENAAHITYDLLTKDKEFKDNLIESIRDSKEKMRRPQQQMLFSSAQKAINNPPMSKSDKIKVYKAFNLSLVNHNEKEIAAQNRFYSELKKKGYQALLDNNDKEYSSYHAKRPMIVFDTTTVKLQSVTTANPKVVDKLYKKYNAERIAKEAINNTLGLVASMGNYTVSNCKDYVTKKNDEYLGR